MASKEPDTEFVEKYRKRMALEKEFDKAKIDSLIKEILEFWGDYESADYWRGRVVQLILMGIDPTHLVEPISLSELNTEADWEDQGPNGKIIQFKGLQASESLDKTANQLNGSSNEPKESSPIVSDEEGNLLVFGYKEYGALVGERRSELGVSIYKLKEEVELLCNQKLKRPFISEVERARCKPTLEQFLAINYLLWGEAAPTEVVFWAFVNRGYFKYSKLLGKERP
jgi:hypothetical protein